MISDFVFIRWLSFSPIQSQHAINARQEKHVAKMATPRRIKNIYVIKLNEIENQGSPSIVFENYCLLLTLFLSKLCAYNVV